METENENSSRSNASWKGTHYHLRLWPTTSLCLVFAFLRRLPLAMKSSNTVSRSICSPVLCDWSCRPEGSQAPELCPV